MLIYQLVSLTKGGETTKMSKRRGDVVFLDELMDEIGVDAARWYLVNRGPDQAIEIREAGVDLARPRVVGQCAGVIFVLVRQVCLLDLVACFDLATAKQAKGKT